MTWLCLKDNALSDSQMGIVTGPRIDLAITLIDRMKSTFWLNIVSTHYITRTFHVPLLDFAIYKKREEDCNSEDEFKTNVEEIAKEMISKAASYCIHISCVVFDSWYADKDLIEHILRKSVLKQHGLYSQRIIVSLSQMIAGQRRVCHTLPVQYQKTSLDHWKYTLLCLERRKHTMHSLHQ
jgi:hypothetical protein